MSKKDEIQNNPTQHARIITNQLLAEAGNACTKELILRLRHMSNEAKHASVMLQKIPREIIMEAQCGNILYSAEHNATAIAMCLSTAADAAEYLNQEICRILREIDAAEMRQIKVALAIAKERKKAEKKHAEYLRAKKRKAEELTPAE